MSENGLAVGIVGTGLLGRQIAESLIGRGFPVGLLRFFGGADSLAEELEIEDRTFPVESLRGTVGRLELAFLTRETPWTERDVEGMILAGATVIDCSGRYARELDVPLIVPECNADALGSCGDRRLVASPDAAAIALSVVLAPLQAQAGVSRVVATSLEPVSDAGDAGVEELSRQTVDLLHGRSTEAEVFPARVAFNILPRLGDVAPSGDSVGEEQCAWQVRRILALPELPLTLSRVCVPLFYGTGIALNVELQTPMDAGEAGELLRTAPGILATAADEEAGLSVADAVGQDGTIVSRIRADRSTDNALNLWVAFDNARKGGAVNAVQIAEVVAREWGLGSGQ